MTSTLSRERAWRRIDAAHSELANMRGLLLRLQGGRWQRLKRRLGLGRPHPDEAVVRSEIADIEADLRAMIRDYTAIKAPPTR